MCLFDGVETATVAETVTEAGLITTNNVLFCYPKYGGYALSSIVACGIVMSAREHDDIPFHSFSNYTSEDIGQAIPVNIASTDKSLNLDDAALLNTAGVVTWSSFGAGGKVLWGSWMVSFVDGVVDYMNDTYIPRMMGNYIQTLVTLNLWANVDDGINKNLVNAVVAKLNAIGGALQGKGALLGFEIQFLESDNPSTDMATGKITLRMKYLIFKEASDISVILELDVSYLQGLFA